MKKCRTAVAYLVLIMSLQQLQKCYPLLQKLIEIQMLFIY